ncbi:MAG TPA: Nif3-like dinuclear metal center hexameric protein [Tenuifilaceae bacterium]|nr:Nif3-like dinuclear metal center hexameric protein [Tenuifilaceae bacterium]HPE17304.1 Nif3-like dinuclear metal center hexameric protein [Tenuifilaceae bacterium]HPJ44530.1 Nif3-like dinuclear metal center hexameric protein [Tenuifilaceae bacterium]HPQ33068.1 Nif3-like dinuclear metal center hexameric protein [Tenuifilaceae bacterium]HRX67612.1 Nif3-like dinuclear metal center hexameric protein [Tenuifilaceae bacterium]
MIVREVTSILEQLAPLAYQESYDNAGLQVGSPAAEVEGILLCIDVTPEVVDEAIARRANLIISHHPLIFSGLKRITGSTYVEKALIKAIENRISIYSAHTNIDSVWNGVSMKIANLLELSNLEILDKAENQLVKLVTFAPQKNAQEVRLAMFGSGAGQIGEYDQCSYNTEGTGTFRAGEGTNPHVGLVGEAHFEPETRIEVIVPKPVLSNVIAAMQQAHPYEEVAFDVYPLLNKNPRAGIGMLGTLPTPLLEEEFLLKVKSTFSVGSVRHTNFLNKPVSRIAFCGGSGAGLISKAIAAKADVYLTGDIKYHQFFDADGKILLADIGHFESEQYTVDIFYDLLTKKIANFAVLKSNVSTNPVNYL